MQILLLVLVVAAFASGLVVMRTTVRLARIAPSGKRLAMLGDLARRQYFAVGERLGTASHEHIARFRLGLVAFFASAGAAAILFAAGYTLRDIP